MYVHKRLLPTKATVAADGNVTGIFVHSVTFVDSHQACRMATILISQRNGKPGLRYRLLVGWTSDAIHIMRFSNAMWLD